MSHDRPNRTIDYITKHGPGSKTLGSAAAALAVVAVLGPVTVNAAPREAASPAACQSAASHPPIATAKAALDRDPADLRARFVLADAWSDVGCFDQALQVLQAAAQVPAPNSELETRLRVARSLVGEEHFFDNLERADAAAQLKRDSFRCTALGDLSACAAALRARPGDAALLRAQADADRARSESRSESQTASASQGDPSAATLAADSAPAALAGPVGSAGSPPAQLSAPRLATHRAAPPEIKAVRYSNAEPETSSH